MCALRTALPSDFLSEDIVDFVGANNSEHSDQSDQRCSDKGVSWYFR